MRSAKDERIQQAGGCEMYDPCSLCYKCMNKATHLYARCAKCPIEHDAHTHKNRSWFIKRENFGIVVSDETKLEINKLGDK